MNLEGGTVAIVVYKISHDEFGRCAVSEEFVQTMKEELRLFGIAVVAVIRPKQTYRDA